MNTKTIVAGIALASLAGQALAQCDNTLLLAPDRLTSDAMGSACAMADDVLFVGAPYDDNARGVDGGSIYVWTKFHGQWSYYSRFQAINSSLRYGRAISTDGATMVASTADGPVVGRPTGFVYVTEKHADGFWYPAALPLPPGGIQPGCDFGYSVAVNGTRLAIGAPGYDYNGEDDMGAVFMYRKVNGAWQYHMTIVHPTFDSAAGDNFGTSIGLSAQGRLVVGAPNFDWTEGQTTFVNNGAVYMFVPSGGSYALPQGARVTAGLGDNIHIGTAVAIDGDFIAVGVPTAWGYGGTNAGTVSAFHREADNSLDSWGWAGAYPAVAGEQVGWKVSIAGHRIAAAAGGTDRAFEFEIPQEKTILGLSFQRIIDGSAIGGSSGFASSIAVTDNDLLIGDTYYDGGATNTGSARVFTSTAETPNDNPESATPIAIPNTLTGCTSFATATAQNMGADICGSSKDSPDVWYKFTADRNGQVTAVVHGFDTVLSAHSQEPRGWDSYDIACNDDINGAQDRGSRITFNVTNGQEVLVRVSGYNGAVGSYTMEIGYECAADFNDDFFLDFFDLDAFIACFEGIECPAGKTADFNGDEFVDFFDLDAFTAAFEDGC